MGITYKSDIQELLHRAYMFDDKPHKLFSHIAEMARRWEKDEAKRYEIERLMDEAYSGRRKR